MTKSVDNPGSPRIVLAHDWLVGMRGGERVLDHLARLYGPTDLYTLVSDGRPLTDAISACRIHTSPLQHLPGAAGRFRRHYFPLMPWAVGQLEPLECDLIISTSSAVMKSINPRKGTPHLCYCHNPARYVWEQTADYAHGRGGFGRACALRLFRGYFRGWDRRTASRVTRFLANSQHTAARIHRAYGRAAHVVYPPVRTGFFTITDEAGSDESSRKTRVAPREDWFLVVSALEPYKRTDLAIEAANRAGFQLRIVGTGSQLNHLRELAGNTVELLGRVDDETLRDLLRRARALIYPQVEDFGIIPVEAQACGCPVLAYAAGGALESVTPAPGSGSGVFFHDQTPAAIIDAVRELDQITINPAVCRTNAERFSEDVFDAAIQAHVAEMVG